MKTQFTFLFLFSFLISFAQERISDIENNVLPDDVYGVNSHSSFELDGINYLLYIDQTQLQLVNMDDLQTPIKSFDLQVDCPNILGLDKLNATNRTFYVHDRGHGQAFNIDSSENQKMFSFLLPKGFKTGLIGEEYLYRFDRVDDIMGVEIIDLNDFTHHYYEYEGIITLKLIDEHLMTISEDWNEWSELDVNTGALRLIHSGPGTIHSQNLTNVTNEFLCIDSSENVFLYDLETETSDTICYGVYDYFYGKFFNSKNCYYYHNPYLINGSNFTYVRNKTNCNELEVINIGQYLNPITYSNDSVDIVFFSSLEKVVIYNEMTSETINIEIQFNSVPKIVTIGHMFYLLSRVNAENNEFRLDKIDVLTGDYSSIQYVIPGMYSIDKLIEGENNNLIAVAKIGHILSKVQLSTLQDDFTIETATSSRSYGLIKTSEWAKNGSTITSQVQYNTTTLAFFEEGNVQATDIDSLKSGYINWDNLIAGIVSKEESLYFQLIDQSTLSVKDERFVSSFSINESHEIVKIGDQYYELAEEKLYARYPEVASFTSYEDLKVYEVVMQSESEIIVIGQREGFALALLKIDESGISSILSDLSSSFYKSHSIWTAEGQRKVFHFENDDKDISYIVCVDTQTGMVSEIKTLNGTIIKSNSNEANYGWITLIVESTDDEITFVATNGKKIKTFSTDQITIDLTSSPRTHYENGRLFYTDNALGMVSLLENGDYTLVSLDMEGYYWFQDILFIEGEYYLFHGFDQGISVFVLNEDLTSSELLIQNPFSFCNFIEVSVLGVTADKLIVFSMNSVETGNELWSINISTQEVELFADLDGFHSSGFKSIEFYQDGNVYFKAADSTGIVQLYKLAVDLQPVSTNEVTSKLSTLKVYPNPASENITFDQALDNVRVMDIQGIVRLSKGLNSTSKTISLGSLPTGIYFVEGYSENGEMHRGKFVKIQ